MDVSLQGKGHMSEEEDDLELLRMAALQTLKKPERADNHHTHSRGGKPLLQMPYSHNKYSSAKRMRGFHHMGPGRGARNGQFNGRMRSTNLIAIQTAPEEPQEKVMEIPKLTLPQDRYCNNNTIKEETKEEKKSKFNRYDKSDNDSDSEDEHLQHDKSDGDDISPDKLTRSNSLEELMQELEFEISGEKPHKATKSKPKKLKVKKKNSESEEIAKVEEKVVVKDEVIVKEEPVKKEVIKSLVANRKTSPIKEQQQPVRKDFYTNKTHYVKTARPYTQPPPIVNNPVPVLYHPLIPPPHFPQRPLSPLNINTGLSTITMAPLSPRSAAFVMQNREIIERRKKSPRRSFSRSPSPTPRPVARKSRSPSPRRYPRSASPKRMSPVRRVVPRRVTSPRRRNSAERKVSPKVQRKSPPKMSVRDRLGTRKEEEAPAVKKKRSLSPEPKSAQSDDPVLEARKKKFQDTKTIKEGIIRLKPKTDDSPASKSAEQQPPPTPPEEEKVETDDLLDLDAGDTMDDIFSDDESENEVSEGRFKSATTSRRNVSLLPFSQLVNGPNREAAPAAKSKSTTKRERRRGERRRSKSRSGKERSSKTEKRVRVTSPIESKKIEIRIRNPAKYESRSESKRKVAVESENIVSKSSEAEASVQQQPHIVIDDDEDVKKSEGGDLRAQLSRKRAERQHHHHHHHHHHKLPMATEDVQSRLLQSALQDAVYKKAKKSRRKENEKVSSSKATTLATKDKLPIHMRLGVSSGGDASDSAEPSPPKKKKKKSSRILEQVLFRNDLVNMLRLMLCAC